MISIEYLFILFLVSLYILKPQMKLLNWLIPFVFLFFGMARGLNVGTDHAFYEHIIDSFRGFKSPNWDLFHFEKGYLFLAALFKLYSNNYLLFTSLTFILFMGGVMIFISSYKINNSWAYFIFYTFGFYFLGYNTMRQTIGIALNLACISLLYKRKFLYFGTLTLLIALLMHKSGAILILLIPIYNLSEKLKTIPKSVLYFIVVFSFLSFYIGQHYIKDLFMTVLSTINLSDDYYQYIEYESESYGNALSIMYSLFAIALIYFKTESGDKFCFYTYIFSIVLFNFANMMNGRAIRMADGFMFFLIPLIPLMLKERLQYKMIFKVIVLLFCIAYFVRSFWLGNVGEVNPYYYSF